MYSIRPSVYLTGGGVRPLRGRLEGVCDTPPPIPDKCLLNTYLLNPIAGKDGIRLWIGLPIPDKFLTGRVGRKSIRPTNAHDKGQMIRLPDAFVGVCDTPLPEPDKYLLNTYLLNPMLGKDGIHP